MQRVSAAKVRVLLVDDHADVRKVVRELLCSYSDIEVVGEAVDGVQAIDDAERLQPDAVVMDIRMPRLDGIQATQAIKTHNPGVCVVGLSIETRERSIADMLSAGASIVLRKEAAGEQLHSAIRAHVHTLQDVDGVQSTSR